MILLRLDHNRDWDLDDFYGSGACSVARKTKMLVQVAVWFPEN